MQRMCVRILLHNRVVLTINLWEFKATIFLLLVDLSVIKVGYSAIGQVFAICVWIVYFVASTDYVDLALSCHNFIVKISGGRSLCLLDIIAVTTIGIRVDLQAIILYACKRWLFSAKPHMSIRLAFCFAQVIFGVYVFRMLIILKPMSQTGGAL